jgi:hypothetical protein
MKLSTNIDTATQKRLTQEAITANEAEVFGVLLRNGVDIDNFDENAFLPSEDAPQWELDIKKKLELLASLKSRLERLG